MKTENLIEANSAEIRTVLQSAMKDDGRYTADQLRAMVIEAGYSPDYIGKKNYRLHQAISAMRKINQLAKDDEGAYSLNPDWSPNLGQSKTMVVDDTPKFDERDPNADLNPEFVEMDFEAKGDQNYPTKIVGSDNRNGNRSKAHIKYDGKYFEVYSCPGKGKKKIEDIRQAITLAEFYITQAFMGKKGFETNMEPETDETRLIDAVSEKFDAIGQFAQQVCEGTMRSLIVAGAPGVGKTYTVEKVIDNWSDKLKAEGSQAQAGLVNAKVTPAALYITLYQYRHHGSVLVLDDCDGIYRDEDAMNMLKAACDSKPTRTIHYNSGYMDNNDIPRHFVFNGGIIFITNTDIDYATGNIKAHLEALYDRSFYWSSKCFSVESRLARIKGVMAATDIMERNGADTPHARKVMLDFFESNKSTIRPAGITLRGLEKMLTLYKMYHRGSYKQNDPAESKFIKMALEVMCQ